MTLWQEAYKMTKTVMLNFAAALVLIPCAQSATVQFNMTVDKCTGGCGISPFATVIVQELSATQVKITETLASDNVFAGSGSATRAALYFNISGLSSLTDITIALADTTNFAIGPTPDNLPSFGPFTNSIKCTTCQGGQTTNTAGPLVFTVTRSAAKGGIDVNNFIANANGYYVGSDVASVLAGGSGNTGNVFASANIITTTATPEPSTTMMMFGAVALFGAGALRKWRRS